MATPSLAKGLDQELTCPICLELFKEPTILPCLHSFCKGCLRDMVKKPVTFSDGTIHCPKCRTQHPLPSGGVEGFPTHFTLTNLVELLNIHGQEDTSITSTAPILKCENGLDDNPATSKCFDCNVYFCKNCTDLHRKMGPLKHHKIWSLADIRKGGAKSLEQKRYCLEHEEEELKLYCRTCCDVICRDCTIVTHKSHDYTFIKSAKDELVEQMESILRKVEAKEIEFASHREHLERVEQESTDNIKQCRGKVVQFFADWYQRIKAKEEDLLQQLDGFHGNASKKLAAERDAVELMTVQVDSAIKFTKQLLDSGTPCDIAMMSARTCKQLNIVKELKWDPEEVSPCNCDFVSHDANPTAASVKEVKKEVHVEELVCTDNLIVPEHVLVDEETDYSSVHVLKEDEFEEYLPDTTPLQYRALPYDIYPLEYDDQPLGRVQMEPTLGSQEYYDYNPFSMKSQVKVLPSNEQVKENTEILDSKNAFQQSIAASESTCKPNYRKKKTKRSNTRQGWWS